MGLWERFWSAFIGDPVAPRPASPAVASEKIGQGKVDAGRARADASVEARAQRAAERLVDDERLRQNLTDQQFGPLIDWALGLLERVAQATAGQSDAVADRRIDRVLDEVRETLTELDRLAGRHGATGPAGIDKLVAEVIRMPDAEAARRTVVGRAADPPDEAAADQGTA